jgi:hypothetical protein
VAQSFLPLSPKDSKPQDMIFSPTTMNKQLKLMKKKKHKRTQSTTMENLALKRLLPLAKKLPSEDAVV